MKDTHRPPTSQDRKQGLEGVSDQELCDARANIVRENGLRDLLAAIDAERRRRRKPERVRRRHPFYGFDVLVAPEHADEPLFMVPWERAPADTKPIVKQVKAAGLDVKAVKVAPDQTITVEIGKAEAEKTENVLPFDEWRARHAR